ncbi:12659_t:CDS:2, partial [Entrophospora sp. SA101]
KNPKPEPIAFKVKTTAPKQYCVRPNSGRIEANQTVDVQVILQAMKEDPPLDFKCKDKFLVQSIPISPEQENLTLQELWATIEKQTKGSIKETKIRCVYLPPISTLDNPHQQPSSPDLPVNNVTNNVSQKI